MACVAPLIIFLHILIMNSNGFGKLAENKAQYVYVDIFFTSDPVLSPYYINGWDKVETIYIPKCLYEVLDFYALDADPNIWFIKHISETFGRDFKYAGANNSVFFNNLILNKDNELIEGSEVQFTYRLSKDDKEFLIDKNHEAFSWKYIRSEM